MENHSFISATDTKNGITHKFRPAEAWREVEFFRVINNIVIGMYIDEDMCCEPASWDVKTGTMYSGSIRDKFHLIPYDREEQWYEKEDAVFPALMINNDRFLRLVINATMADTLMRSNGWRLATWEEGLRLLIQSPKESLSAEIKSQKVVCLCGSTRFKDAFIEANREESVKGNIVLTVAMFGHLEGLDMDGEAKKTFDELHFRKIDLCDEVLVLNVDGYIGESTAREIAYAKSVGKPVRFLLQER